MKTVIALLLLLVLLVLLIAGLVWVGRRVGHALRARGPWQPYEQVDDGCMWVGMRCGEQRELIGKVSLRDPDYDMQLYEMRNEASDKIAATNNTGQRGLLGRRR